MLIFLSWGLIQVLLTCYNQNCSMVTQTWPSTKWLLDTQHTLHSMYACPRRSYWYCPRSYILVRWCNGQTFLGSSCSLDDSKRHSKKLISSCSSTSPPLIDVHISNKNRNDYCLCSDLCFCIQVIIGFYQNCRGLRTKLCILKCNGAVFNYVFICLTETWVCDSFHDSELGLTNYTIYVTEVA